ncbi:UNVERIFIED_CONTAM: hypothetical protein RMT77_016570 [Armadillidium vulgare]
MRHLAAYLLAAISDNEVPSETKISNILGSVGVEADEKQIKTVIERFAGKAPSKVIAEGLHLLSSMPSASGAVAVAAPSGKAPAGGAPAAAKEEKKEEKKKEEPEEESDDDMGFGLFD